MNLLGQLIKNLIDLFQVDLVAAVGQAGETGEGSKIIDVMNRVTDTMKQVAQWEQVVRLMMEHPIYGKLAALMSGMSRPVLDMIDEFRREYFEQLATIAQTDRCNIHIKMEDLPNIDELHDALGRFSARALKEGAILGDFYQTHFRVQRESAELGIFSRSSVIENLRCGLFCADDMYWSEKLQRWRRLPELENDVELTIGSFKQALGEANSNPYAVLQVSPDATWPEVKQAYRTRCQEYHPDKMGSLGTEIRELSERKMKEINRAFEILRQKFGEAA
jgi:DnaJ-domain-containing protein 1